MKLLIDSHLIESGIKDRVSIISQLFTAANNKYLSDNNREEASGYIMHWNVNNVCGLITCQVLPYEAFKWVFNENI